MFILKKFDSSSATLYLLLVLGCTVKLLSVPIVLRIFCLSSLLQAPFNTFKPLPIASSRPSVMDDPLGYPSCRYRPIWAEARLPGDRRWSAWWFCVIFLMKNVLELDNVDKPMSLLNARTWGLFAFFGRLSIWSLSTQHVLLGHWCVLDPPPISNLPLPAIARA